MEDQFEYEFEDSISPDFAQEDLPEYEFDEDEGAEPFKNPLLWNTARRLALVRDDMSPEGEMTALSHLDLDGEESIRAGLVDEEIEKAQSHKLAILTGEAKKGVAPPIEAVKGFLSLEGDGIQYDTSTILEQLYAKRVIDKATGAYPDHSYNRAADDPNFDLIERMVEEQIVMGQIYARQRAWLESISKGKEGDPELWHALKNWIPFVQTSAMGNALGDAGAVDRKTYDWKFFTSDSLERDAQKLRSISNYAEREAALRKAIEHIAIERDNPLAALAYLKGVMEYGIGQRVQANMLDTIDIADVATPFIPGATRTVRAIHRTGEAVSEAVEQATETLEATIKEVVKDDPSVANVAAINGDVEGAAVFTYLEDRRNMLLRQVNERTKDDREAQEFLNNIPTIMRDNWMDEMPSVYGQSQVELLREGSARGNIDLINAMADTNMVQSRGFRAVATGLREALQKWSSYTPQTATQNVLEVRYSSPDKGLFQSSAFAEVLIGYEKKPFTGDGTLARRQARVVAEGYGLKDKDYKLITEGENTFISVEIPFDETTSAYRAALALDSPTPENLFNVFFSVLRGKDAQTSRAMAESAKTAQFGQNQFLKMVKNAAQRHLQTLRRKEKKDLEDFINHQKTAEHFDQLTGEFYGMGEFSVTAKEFVDQWESFHGYTPRAQVAATYRDYVAIHDMQLVMQNIGEFANLQRLGVEDHFFPRRSKLDQDNLSELPSMDRPVMTGQGIDPSNSRWDKPIQGKTLNPEEDHLFFDRTDDPRVLVIDPSSADADGRMVVQLLRQSDLSQEEFKALIAEYRKEGGRLVELNSTGRRQAADFFEEELKGIRTAKDGEFPPDTADFILSKRVSSQRVNLTQITRNPGGHVMYEPGYYIKVGGMSFGRDEARYTGDKALFHFLYEKDGKALLPALNTAREKMKEYLRLEGQLSREATFTGIQATEAAMRVMKREIQEVLADTPATFEKFYGMYRPTEKGAKPFASINVPFQLVKSGQNTAEVFDYEGFAKQRGLTFRNSQGASRLDQESNAQFASPRNRRVDTVLGDEAAPYYDVTPSQLLSPFKTLEKSTTRIANSAFFDRYKERAIDRFLGEYGDLLEGGVDAHRLNPLHTVMTAQLDPKTTKNVDIRKLNAAEQQLKIIRRTLSLESDWDKAVRRTADSLQQWLYSEYGLPGIKLVPEALINTIKRPDAYFRNVAFNLKLGLFNPIQLFKQSMTYNNTMALAGPAVANKALPGAVMMNMLQWTADPVIIAKMAEKASKMGVFGWRKSDFIEAYDFLKSSGWQVVGGEVGNLDLVRGVQFTSNRLRRFIDSHTYFFDAGERFNRYTAFAASYQKWRMANPNAKFTRQVGDQLLNEADLFAGNMTRFSNADWQHGIFSPATQFFSYQARLTEQLLTGLGGQLTPIQRARMFAVYSAMFGLPAGLATATSYPAYDSIRESIVARYGINPDGQYMEALSEGILGMLATLAYGERTTFSEDYAPGGLPIINDIWGDKPFWEIAGGASASVAGDIIESAIGIKAWASNFIQHGNTENFPMTMDDFVKIATNATSLSSLHKFAIAVDLFGNNRGKYLTKDGTPINSTNVNIPQAVITMLTGVGLREESDTWKLAARLYGDREAQEGFMKTAKEEWTKAFNLEAAGDLKGAGEALKRGMYWASKLNEANKKKAYSFALNGGILSEEIWNRYQEDQQQAEKPTLKSEQDYRATFRRNTGSE